MDGDKMRLMEFLHTRKGRILSVFLLAICAAALCKPFVWLNYLASGTFFSWITWLLPCILPTLAAFVAGPVGAVIVSLGAVYPRFFIYKPYQEMFLYNALYTAGTFLALSVFSCVFYIFAKRGGAKNLMLGLICGTLDHLFIGTLCNALTVHMIDKATQILLSPIVAIFFAASAAHVLVFLLQRKEKTAEGE